MSLRFLRSKMRFSNLSFFDVVVRPCTSSNHTKYQVIHIIMKILQNSEFKDFYSIY